MTSVTGWITIQQRDATISQKVDFFRCWRDYEAGFGNVGENFWIGLDLMNELTSFCHSKLRVDLTAYSGDTAYAEYGVFKVNDASDGYKLLVEEYSGTAGNGLSMHNGKRFYTRDGDTGTECAERFRGAWWYASCTESNLNALMTLGEENYHTAHWRPFKSYEPMEFTRMSITPSDGCSFYDLMPNPPPPPPPGPPGPPPPLPQ